METGLVKVDITAASMLVQTCSVFNSVWINFFHKSQEFFINESGGTYSPTRIYSTPPFSVPRICLNDLSHHEFTPFHLFPLIDFHLQDPILSLNLAARISSAQLNQTLGFPQPNLVMSVNVVLTQQHIFVLPPPVYCLPQAKKEDQEEEQESTCAICLEDLWNDNNHKTISELHHCSHRFHQGCIDQWLWRRNSCPLCRQTVIKELD